MKIHLGGHLSWYVPGKQSWVEVKLPKPTSLAEVLKQLGVPVAEIAIGTVNAIAVFTFDNVVVRDTDQVEVYPPIGGGE